MSEHVLKPGRYFIIGFALAMLVVFADQYSKWFILENLLSPRDVPVPFKEWFTTRHIIFTMNGEAPEIYKTLAVTPFLNMVVVWNQGVSFGLFNNASPIAALVFMGISLLLSMLMLIWLALSQKKSVALALALIIGGAIGNVIDRVRFGAVADFIDVYAGAFHWPAFNVGDSCIVVGALVLILDSCLSGKDAARAGG